MKNFLFAFVILLFMVLKGLTMTEHKPEAVPKMRWLAKHKGWQYSLRSVKGSYQFEVVYNRKVLACLVRQDGEANEAMMRAVQLMIDCDRREPKQFELDILNHHFAWIARLVRAVAVADLMRFEENTRLGQYLNYVFYPSFPQQS